MPRPTTAKKRMFQSSAAPSFGIAALSLQIDN